MYKSRRVYVVWLLMFFIILFTIIVLVNISIAFFATNHNSSGTITIGDLNFKVETLFYEKSGLLPGDSVDFEINVINKNEDDSFENLSDFVLRLSSSSTCENANFELLTFSLDSENWVKKDNYFYYKDVIKKGEELNIKNSIGLSGEIDSSYMEKEINLTLTFEAVQADKEAYKSNWQNAPQEWQKIIDQVI